MRKRQICYMHGGQRKYQGSGTTINWNTTTPNSNSLIETPTQPTIPTKPLPNTNNNDDGRIAAIVGLGSLSAFLLGTTVYYRNKANLREFDARELPGYGEEDIVFANPEHQRLMDGIHQESDV